MAIESLRPAMTVSRISRAMDVPRSTIYYRRIGKWYFVPVVRFRAIRLTRKPMFQGIQQNRTSGSLSISVWIALRESGKYRFRNTMSCHVDRATIPATALKIRRETVSNIIKQIPADELPAAPEPSEDNDTGPASRSTE
jgi:hypothetical protein